MEKKYKMANKNPTVIEGANSSPKMFVLFLYIDGKLILQGQRT